MVWAEDDSRILSVGWCDLFNDQFLSAFFRLVAWRLWKTLAENRAMNLEFLPLLFHLLVLVDICPGGQFTGSYQKV